MTETIQFPGVAPRPWYLKYPGLLAIVAGVYLYGWLGLGLGFLVGAAMSGFWWLGNDEASAQGNSFYYRYLRNPIQNFRWYVIGLVDRPHWVTGRAPADVNQRSDMRPPQSGWCWSFIWPLLPYVSYSSRHFTFYVGWQPAGAFGAKLNFSNSDLA